ncbi:MAG: EF-P lysine aminoacylase EpmA [Myxococcota bacterium]
MEEPTDTEVVRILQSRAALFRSIRTFFETRGFVEVDTPAIVPSPGLDVHLSAIEVRGPDGRPIGWLATSPEYQMKRLLAAGATRIFQLGKSYRADEHGPFHEREFTMLEWYRTDATSDDVMADTETLVASLAETWLGSNTESFSTPWERRTVDEVMRAHTGSGADDFKDDEAFFRAWVDHVQPNLGVKAPVFVVDWPRSMASLAQLNPDGTADRFEGFYRGVELCNGFGELTDPIEQRARFETDQRARSEAGLPVYPIDERFIQALERGIPPSAGNALGVDRLLMLLGGADSIQTVMPFPEERL